MFAVRPLEFDRIVAAVADLSATPLGRAMLLAVEPKGEPRAVALLQQGTTEAVRFSEQHGGFPLRAGQGLPEALDALQLDGQPLEPLALRTLADFVDSVGQSRTAIQNAGPAFPLLGALVAPLTSFDEDIAAVRAAIDAGGDVLDSASPALRGIRDRLRRLRQQLLQALERLTRGRDTAKHLQDDIVTERNGRAVLLVRAEHRANVPGIVHGSSASGASLFLEPSAVVDLNNDIVETGEREREEIFRILLALTDRFRVRAADMRVVQTVATDLDVVQARARYSARIGGMPPTFVQDGSLTLRGARHPLLAEPVPIDVVLDPPSRILLITGPNTGGKTVALKTAGLFALMAQAGLHLPATTVRLPVFRSVFADIGDDQSIAASLSTFSAHISKLVAMDRSLDLPSLVLLDEVGTGTDPNEGGALATAVVSHFRTRGAHLIATTHFDAVKTWGTATAGVTVAAFAFNPQTYAPTYRLVYGAPGRSLAIEMAQRLGLPAPVIAAARSFLGDDQKRLQAHLERVDAQARRLDAEHGRLERERRALADERKAIDARERALTERETAFRTRLNEKVDDRIRQARREIDAVIEQMRDRSNALLEQASSRPVAVPVNTGQTGRVRAEARAAVEQIAERLRNGEVLSPVRPLEDATSDATPLPSASAPSRAATLAPGARVSVGTLGLEGTVQSVTGAHVDVDVRGKRMRARVGEVTVISGPPQATKAAPVRVHVDLAPREGLLSELQVIGCGVDEAVDRVSKFLDGAMLSDLREVRIVHGFGTGQLRKGIQAFLKRHPLVLSYGPAPETQGGGGATRVTLKD